MNKDETKSEFSRRSLTITVNSSIAWYIRYSFCRQELPLSYSNCRNLDIVNYSDYKRCPCWWQIITGAATPHI